MSDESTKKATEGTEPSVESLAEMPEINDRRFRRVPGRGHHATRSAGEIVAIDNDLWPHFGSQQAVNDALRQIVEKSHGA